MSDIQDLRCALEKVYICIKFYFISIYFYLHIYTHIHMSVCIKSLTTETTSWGRNSLDFKDEEDELSWFKERNSDLDELNNFIRIIQLSRQNLSPGLSFKLTHSSIHPSTQPLDVDSSMEKSILNYCIFY